MTAPVPPEPVPLPPGWRLEHHVTVDSTNRLARALGDHGAPDRTAVWGERQTAGRGRRGRRWTSPSGNLYASLLLRPRVEAAEAARLTFVAGLALAQAVEAVAPRLRVRVKWPNDLLIDGEKLAGLLLEAGSGERGGVGYVVIGSGVNTAHHPDDAERPATSLAAHGYADVTPAGLLSAYLERFEPLYTRWLESGFEAIRPLWLARAAGIGGPVTVRLERERFTGAFRDLDPSGALVVTLTDGTDRRVTAGDVFLPGRSGVQ